MTNRRCDIDRSRLHSSFPCAERQSVVWMLLNGESPVLALVFVIDQHEPARVHELAVACSNSAEDDLERSGATVTRASLLVGYLQDPGCRAGRYATLEQRLFMTSSAALEWADEVKVRYLPHQWTDT